MKEKMSIAQYTKLAVDEWIDKDLEAVLVAKYDVDTLSKIVLFIQDGMRSIPFAPFAEWHHVKVDKFMLLIEATPSSAMRTYLLSCLSAIEPIKYIEVDFKLI